MFFKSQVNNDDDDSMSIKRKEATSHEYESSRRKKKKKTKQGGTPLPACSWVHFSREFIKEYSASHPESSGLKVKRKLIPPRKLHRNQALQGEHGLVRLCFKTESITNVLTVIFITIWFRLQPVWFFGYAGWRITQLQ